MLELNKSLTAGTKGLHEGYDPHILNVARMEKQTLDGVSQESVASCWVESEILPTAQSAEISSTMTKGTMGNKMETSNSLPLRLKVSIRAKSGRIDVLHYQF